MIIVCCTTRAEINGSRSAAWWEKRLTQWFTLAPDAVKTSKRSWISILPPRSTNKLHVYESILAWKSPKDDANKAVGRRETDSLTLDCCGIRFPGRTASVVYNHLKPEKWFPLHQFDGVTMGVSPMFLSTSGDVFVFSRPTQIKM